MRRDSSTVIALVGHVSGGLLAALTEPGNVSVVRAAWSQSPDAAGAGRTAGPNQTAGPNRTAGSASSARSSTPQPARSAESEGAASGSSTARGSAPGPASGMGASWAVPGWEPGARAMREAARRRATYVVVANDPLAGVASAWREMWTVAVGPDAAAAFEHQAADTLAAWRGKQFELPDYYLAVAPAQHVATGPDLYLARSGPQLLRGRPCRDTAGPV